MRKILLLTATAFVTLLSSCNSCGGNAPQGVFLESETDSIYMANDSTIADQQTFVFEGFAPMDNNLPAQVILAVRTISLNNDGTYTITTDYVDEGIATQTDNGEAIVVFGMDNDSTATVLELISYNNRPTVNFKMHGDSTLVRVDKNGKPVSSNPNHKLTIKK